MEHQPAEDVTWTAAPEENFTGEVWFGELTRDDGPSGLVVLGVQFTPGARTGWHHHPGGQTLYVVSGSGYVANEAGERRAITPGDTVNVPAGELHWHGASPDAPMLHLSITTGGATEWSGRKVSDGEYRGAG